MSSSPDHLLITDRPWLMAGVVWLLGLAALYGAISGNIEPSTAPGWAVRLLVGVTGAGAVVIAWAAFPLQRIDFDSGRAKFRREVSRLGQTKVEIIPLASIARAKVERSRGEASWMDRVALEVIGEEGVRAHPLEWGYVGTSRKPVVAAINDWLDAIR